MANKATDMTPSEQQAKWDDIMGQMCVFVDDTNADIDSAYDWVCEMLNISSFVDNDTAWDSFYKTWESCDNRNANFYNFAWFFTLFFIMTITERNQKLYDLRKKLDQKRLELAWIETEIMAVNSEYDRQNVDLYEEMFGEKNNLWDHLDRMSDTPMAEEVYGGW